VSIVVIADPPPFYSVFIGICEPGPTFQISSPPKKIYNVVEDSIVMIPLEYPPYPPGPSYLAWGLPPREGSQTSN
jgi:hypothetical protein